MKKAHVLRVVLLTSGALLTYQRFQSHQSHQPNARVLEAYQAKKEEEETILVALADLHEEIKDRFYYQQLSKIEQAGYLRLLNGLRQFDESVYLNNHDEYAQWRIFLAVAYDNPEFYWLPENQYAVDFSAMIYPEDARAVYDQLHAIGDAVIAEMPQGSDYDKVKYIYEYIIQNTDYNLAALEDTALAWKSQGIRSVFLDKSSVCNGYSLAFQFLCQKAGIESLYVAGDIVASDLAHAWNLVKIDGAYYAVDTTWGDPVFSSVVADGSHSGGINYAYLCMPASLFHKTHSPWLTFNGLDADAPLTYPQLAEGSQFNYYSLQGAYFEHYDRAQVQAYLAEQVVGGAKTEISLQFATPEGYAAMLAELQSEDSIVHDQFIHLVSYQGYDFIYDEYSQLFTIRAVL